MAVLVKIIGDNDGSDEYAAAEKLKQIIGSTIPKTAMGEIILFPSATLYGQAVKDIDIMMIGNLKNCSAKVRFQHEGANSEEEVFLDSFCTTIEVKSHSISGIRREGTNIKVLYANTGWHNATKQSNDQKTSAMNFFRNALVDSPYITNLLWFVAVNRLELNKLLSVGNNVMPSNVLPASFDFKEIVQKLAYQRVPWRHGNRYSIESGFNGRDTNGVTKALLFFSKAKNGMGELTRKKIEQITNAELGENAPRFDDNTLNIFRGRAGTGKTIDLIKIAVKLVDEEGARVQILTYNRALVSDIRRLFTLAELPDMFEEKCVSVNTMQSYFFGLINGCLYDGKLSGDEFLSKYPELLKEMIDFLRSDEDARLIIKTICEDNPKLNWEYILIDEAQDWSEDERNLILQLYDKNRIFVADGGQQFVRGVFSCDWTVVPNRNNIKLKYCLRQKRNLVRFINHYAEMEDALSNKVIPSEELVGGKVIIIKDKEQFFHTIRIEKGELKKSGNEAYDFLFIVPSTMVENVKGKRRFKMMRDFEQKDILLWDGTNDEKRLEFSIDLDESRVLQYESARGLEGWTVCCMNFDEYMQIKEQQYDSNTEGNALLLESAEEKKKKYLLNWAMIPLTRAIDTLIITLHDERSHYSMQLLRLAEQYPDYVRVL